MAQILVRDLDEALVARLKERAQQNHRSLQGEVKAILETAAPKATRHRRQVAPLLEEEGQDLQRQRRADPQDARLMTPLVVDASVLAKWVLPEVVTQLVTSWQRRT